MDRLIVRLAKMGTFFLALSAFAQASNVSGSLVVEEIDVIQISDFTSRFPAAFIKSFDLSPDGETVAVEFEAWEGEGNRGIWIALWSEHINAFREKFRRLEGPSQDVGTDTQYSYQVRFSPDGRTLLVLTGPRLVALDLPSLEIRYAIEAPVPPGQRGKGPYLDQFAVASKAQRLAVHYQSYDSSDWNFEIQVFDLASGKVVSKWSRPGYLGSVALSDDGRLLAATSNPIARGLRIRDKPNVYVYDASNGETHVALNTDYLVGHVYFTPDGSGLLTSPSETDFAEDSPTDAIKLWDLRTGKLLKEFGYTKYGVRGPAAVSQDGKHLVAVTRWSNPIDRRLDRDVIRGFARLLIWDLAQSEPAFVSEDLQGGARWPTVKKEKFLLGISADGRRLAVRGELISIYAIREAAR